MTRTTLWLVVGAGCMALGIAGSLALQRAPRDQAPPAAPRQATAPPAKAEAPPPPGRGAGVRFGLAKAPSKARGAIRIGSYNTLNLFDPFDDPSLSGEFDDAANVTPAYRVEGLARAIRALDADILALQEVESLEAVRWFRDTFLADMGYDHIASRDVGYYRGVEQAVLSRFPIVEERVWPDADLDAVRRDGPGWSDVPSPGPGQRRAGLRFQRSPLLATVQIAPEERLSLLAIHHKSAREFAWQREAEALATLGLARDLMERDPARKVILLGDFNAAPWDKSLRVYLAGGFYDTMAARSTDRDNPESRLWRTHESERVLDYILVNGAAAAAIVPGSAFVLGTLHPGDDYDFRTDTPPQGYASDHYPIAVDLLVRPGPRRSR